MCSYFFIMDVFLDVYFLYVTYYYYYYYFVIWFSTVDFRRLNYVDSLIS